MTEEEIHKLVDKMISDCIEWSKEIDGYFLAWLNRNFSGVWSVSRKHHQLTATIRKPAIQIPECLERLDIRNFNSVPASQLTYRLVTLEPITRSYTIDEREFFRVRPATMSRFDFMFLQLCMTAHELRTGEKHRPANYEEECGERIEFIEDRRALLKSIIANFLDRVDREQRT